VEKTDTIRAIPGGRSIDLKYDHPTEYNNWKTIVSYCNTTYGEDDGKRYSIKNNRAEKKFTVTAIWLETSKHHEHANT